MSVAIADSFRSILDGAGRKKASIVVDMPIGLADKGERTCEREARRRLGRRRSSVFSSPLRPMLDFADYAAANHWGKENGRGLSKQAWMITPKIREIDAAIAPGDQPRIAEGHPELAFARIGGAPCAHPKRTEDGARERRALLAERSIDAPALCAMLRRLYPSKTQFADDDVIDACVLTLTAEARLVGDAWRLGDGARDARGLLMEISG